MKKNNLTESAVIGEYRLLDLLGTGGMGEVWRATHQRIGHLVAIKVLIRSDHEPGFAERFLNEARILAQLHHPNIVVFHDFLEHAGCPCIVMEYVDGQTLADRLKLTGRLPQAEALAIFQALVKAVACIHGHGIIHRDLKPHNVRIASDGQVKLLDFGIARIHSAPRLTQVGMAIGTMEYMAPEQLRGATVDERSDIWALGVMLYELLTGQLPFDQDHFPHGSDKTGQAAYRPPSTYDPKVAPEIDAMVARCLKKQPAARYQSATELLADLERARSRLSSSRKLKPERNRTGNIALIGQHWPALTILMAFVLLLFVLFSLLPSDQPNSATDSGSPVPATSPTPESTRLKFHQVTIDAPDGKAEVYRNNAPVGSTPYQIEEPVGTRVELKLKRQGYKDASVSFEVNEVRKNYAYPMEKESGSAH